MCIKYNLGTKIKFADALSCLCIRLSVSANGVDPELPLLVMRDKDEGFLADTTKATKAMVLNMRLSLLFLWHYSTHTCQQCHCIYVSSSNGWTTSCFTTKILVTPNLSSLYKFLKVH